MSLIHPTKVPLIMNIGFKYRSAVFLPHLLIRVACTDEAEVIVFITTLREQSAFPMDFGA